MEFGTGSATSSTMIAGAALSEFKANKGAFAAATFPLEPFLVAFEKEEGKDVEAA